MVHTIGGQALVEGVMVISPKRVAMCARRPDKRIVKKTEERMQASLRCGKILFVRGVISLVEMLVVGTRALMWSSNQQLEEEEQIGGVGIALSLFFSLLLALGLFVALPLFVSKLLLEKGILMNLLDGVLRVALFLGYLLVISRFKDIRRVFEYHGAEHMAIHCYESGKKLTLEQIKKFPPEHPRCGTAFLFLVLVVSILVFSFITSDAWILQFLMRLALIPVVAGVSYEVLKLASRHQNSAFYRALIAPGLWFQKITTKQPDRAQIEVAVMAVREAVR